jgi:hypothetical protein
MGFIVYLAVNFGMSLPNSTLGFGNPQVWTFVGM